MTSPDLHKLAREILPCCDGTLQCPGCQDCSKIFERDVEHVTARLRELVGEVLGCVQVRCTCGSDAVSRRIAAAIRALDTDGREGE